MERMSRLSPLSASVASHRYDASIIAPHRHKLTNTSSTGRPTHSRSQMAKGSRQHNRHTTRTHATNQDLWSWRAVTRTTQFVSTRRPLEVTITIQPTGPLSKPEMKEGLGKDETCRDLVIRNTKIPMRAGGDRDHRHIKDFLPLRWDEAMLAFYGASIKISHECPILGLSF
jgi:hypothetical protein